MYNLDDLRTMLDRVNDAEDLIRTGLTCDPTIDALVAKAQRILYESGNRIQHIIEAEEAST